MTEPFEHLIRSTLTDLAEEAPIVHDQLSRAERRVRNRRRATVTMGAVGTLAAILIATPIALAATGRTGLRRPCPARPARRPCPARPCPPRPRPVPTVEPSPGGAPGGPVDHAGPARRTGPTDGQAEPVDSAGPARRTGPADRHANPVDSAGPPGVPGRPTAVPSPSR